MDLTKCCKYCRFWNGKVEPNNCLNSKNPDRKDTTYTGWASCDYFVTKADDPNAKLCPLTGLEHICAEDACACWVNGHCGLTKGE